MKKTKVLIAATGSNRGKTTLMVGLLNLLKGRDVMAFKCGPDYIDPMFHRSVLGVDSTNLDSYFLNENELNKLFNQRAKSINIIESAMGLYDGIGTSFKGSAYEIASILKCPIVLVVDGRGMGCNSIIAEIIGFKALDSNNLISGVILNRVSEKYYKKIKDDIETKTNVKLYGFLPIIKGAEFQSRHLGLISPDEMDFEEKKKLISESVNKYIDIDEIVKSCEFSSDAVTGSFRESCDSLRVAVARDEAFSFIYEENIAVLKRLGADIVYFSPIHDSVIPKGVNALCFYGGYPENYAKELSENVSMKESIVNAANNGTKIIAECGGFMYLTDKITVDEESFDMLGLIKGNAYKTNGLVRFGYVNINVKNMVIKGHEFHHFEIDEVHYSDDVSVVNEASGDCYKGMIYNSNMLAGFPHLYYLSCEELIRDFLCSNVR